MAISMATVSAGGRVPASAGSKCGADERDEVLSGDRTLPLPVVQHYTQQWRTALRPRFSIDAGVKMSMAINVTERQAACPLSRVSLI